MFKLMILELKLKYYIFNYNRFFRMGIVSQYYKEKMKVTQKEIKKIKKCWYM